jgi:DNA-binding HxlR family transcriptional regulator
LWQRSPVDDAEFARWSRAVLALLSRASAALTSEEIAKGIGECDAPTLPSVLEQMEARGLIRSDPDPTNSGAAVRWRHR